LREFGLGETIPSGQIQEVEKGHVFQCGCMSNYSRKNDE